MKTKNYLFTALYLLAQPLYNFASAEDITEALSPAAQQAWPTLNKVGAAKYSKFGFRLYDAELWSSHQGEPAPNNEHTYGFSVKYKRNIKKSALLKHTRKQWLRLDTPQALSKAWLKQLDEIWPDISKGDTLSCLVEPSGKTTFFLNKKKMGEIEDTQFGSAFLNIWLNEKSAFKKQRQQLLGLL